jgi:arginine exporter protein ArgO
MHELKSFALISWIALPTVMFGGYTLLGSVGDRLTDAQRAVFRAGHAHAGVLLVLSLVYEMYMGATSLSLAVKSIGCAALLVGIVLQSGGFFWRAYLGAGTGKNMTRVGALLLAGALVLLIVGIIDT